MSKNARLTKVGLAAAGVVAGAVLAGTMTAQAATPTPAPSSSSSSSGTTATDPHPGDNGADGVPEAQEHHGHGRHALDLSGTVTAVGASSVTIKTATAATEYAVTSTSDIHKNGEAALKDLAVGDAVTFSVDSTNTKQIDKLHAGDKAKDMPPAPASSATTGSTSTGA